MERTEIKLTRHLKGKGLLGFFDDKFRIVTALEGLVEAIEKDYNNPKIDIPEKAAAAALALGNELVQSLNAWTNKGKQAIHLNECVSKCIESINNHRTDIEAAPGFSNWFFRQINAVIAAINSCMDTNIPPYLIEKTQMSYSSLALFKPAVNKVRDCGGSRAGLEFDISLDM